MWWEVRVARDRETLPSHMHAHYQYQGRTSIVCAESTCGV